MELYAIKWRANNRATLYEQAKRRRERNRAEVGPVEKRAWSDEELRQIFAPDRPNDRSLSLKLKRTVQAIEHRRWLTRKSGKADSYTNYSHAA